MKTHLFRPLAGRPGVGTQTLVPLNFSAVVAPLLLGCQIRFFFGNVQSRQYHSLTVLPPTSYLVLRQRDALCFYFELQYTFT